jgi:hypothetical protein
VWLAQRRAGRYAFHFSGRQRAECLAQGPWEGPPGTRLALIGRERAELLALRDALLAGCRRGACGCAGAGAASGGGGAAEEFSRAAAAHGRFRVLSPAGGGGSGGGNGVGADEDAGAGAVVEFSAEGVPLQGVVADAVGWQGPRRGARPGAAPF